MLSKRILGRILRPKHNKTLGMSVLSIRDAKHGKLELRVKYFSVDGKDNPTVAHSLYLYGHQVEDMFEMLKNPEHIKDLSKAVWVPLKKERSEICQR